MIATLQVLARAGYLGVFGAMYACACACVVMLDRFCGFAAVPLLAVASVGTLAWSVFLLDRVKPGDRWRDPADAQAHPDRHALLWRHRRGLRALVVQLALLSVFGLYCSFPALAALVPLALGGVLVYGSLPHRPRPKDVLIVKNLAVAASITALAAFVVGLSGDEPPDLPAGRWPEILTGIGVVSLQVLLDAMLCDLDDTEADRAFHTRTIPVTLGAQRTWLIAGALQTVVCLSIPAVARLSGLPMGFTIVLSTLLALSFLALWTKRHRPVRDAVDLRLPLVIVLAELFTLLAG